MNETLDWNAYTAELVASKGATATDQQRLESLARGRVLDAGCGIGLHLSRLISPGLRELLGVDIGMSGLRYGKTHFAEGKFIAANLCQLPFRDSEFDFIYSIDVIEHLEDPLLALHEYHRVCKPGSLAFIQTPNYPVKRIYDLWHWIRGSKKSLADDPTHISPLNSFQLKRMVKKVGFRLVSFSARNIAFDRILPGRNSLRSTWFGHCFGQKVILVVQKDEIKRV
jgi:2-polyprenyl-3-methyl-5-hydroxy-6-metoxy-1,4-benzoquinol methylase